MNPTITVGSDTGALAESSKPAVMIGSISGAVVGYNFAKKHKVIGLLVGLSVGGWIGKAIADSQSTP